jgi:NTP pyrophosphatase (non-canonical NTP hydrolase)
MDVKERMLSLCKQALDKWGNDVQLIKVVEELTELSLEVQHLRYGKSDIYEVKNELADVMIMLNQLMMMLEITNDDLEVVIDSKLNKLDKKLSE